MNKVQGRLAALEWICLALVTLGFNTGGAHMPSPRRYVGVVFSFLIFGLIAELGQAPARLATAMGGVLTIALLLNKSISGIGKTPGTLITALGSLPAYFGLQPDPEAPTGGPGWEDNLGAIANFTGEGGAGGGGGGGGAW